MSGRSVYWEGLTTETLQTLGAFAIERSGGQVNTCEHTLLSFRGRMCVLKFQ